MDTMKAFRPFSGSKFATFKFFFSDDKLLFDVLADNTNFPRSKYSYCLFS